ETTGLQLVRATPDFRTVEPVLTFRQNVRGFAGNGLAAASDGSVRVAVVENDTHRIMRVDANGRLTREGDFWRFSGGIVVDAADTVLTAGVRRPQSLQEQQNPVDVVFAANPRGSTAAIAAQLPAVRGNTDLPSHAALGGDGRLYVVRRQQF